MSGKKWSVSARIDNDLHSRVCLVSARFGVSDTQMIRDALEALCDYALTRGKYERPMRIIYDEEEAAAMGMVAEPAAQVPLTPAPGPPLKIKPVSRRSHAAV